MRIGRHFFYNPVGNRTHANPVRVAHPFSPFNGPLDGTLDEVRLYDRALSGPEIMTLTQARDYSYDAKGNLTSDRVWGYAYDHENRLTVATNGALRIDYRYDALGRQIERRTSGDTVTTNRMSTTWVRSNYSIFLASVGRPTFSRAMLRQAPPLAVGYSYHPDGHRQRLTYPDGTFITYDYNSNGWLTAIRDGGTNSLVTYEYDAAGRRTKRTLENSTFTVYEYDAANQLSAVSHQQSAGATTNLISRYEYHYDAAGNRTNLTAIGTAVAAVRSESYRYDAADQLIGVTYLTNGLVVRDVTYQFDAAGNRTNVTERGVVTNSLTYTVNSLNQYTRVALGSGGARAYWKLDEGSGSTAADSSGNGHTLTLYNGPTRASAVSSNGVSWDGTDDYGHTATTSLHGFGSFSFSAWLRADQFATNNYHVRLLSKEAVTTRGQV